VPSVGRMVRLPAEGRAYHLALYSDLRESGAGCLPAGISGVDSSTIQGKFVLQVSISRPRPVRAPAGIVESQGSAPLAPLLLPCCPLFSPPFGNSLCQACRPCRFSHKPVPMPGMQIDEIVDVSQAAEQRRGSINNRSCMLAQNTQISDSAVTPLSHRTLKMMLTDGKQTIGTPFPSAIAALAIPAHLYRSCLWVESSPWSHRRLMQCFAKPVGMEKKKLPDLSVLTSAGVKIVVQDFQVRRGIAFLRPENCCVLGGSVLLLAHDPFLLISKG
jgi:hypothetical protein